MGLVIEKGIAIEETSSEKVRIIFSMYNNGFRAEQIALAINKDIEEIKTILIFSMASTSRCHITDSQRSRSIIKLLRLNE